MDQKKLTRIMKALSNEHRLSIYQELLKVQKQSFDSENGCFIYDLCGSLGIGNPTISHHLKELEQAGLINMRKSGKQVVAEINTETAKYLQTYFTSF